MTAIASRRRKRTILGAATAVALVGLAAGLTVVGASTVANSTEGEAVETDTRPVVALPQTDNAGLAVVDDDNRLTSLVVVTLLPSGEGGSIVTIPVDADASIGLGDERRPLNGVLDPEDPAGFFQAVEETLAVALQFGEIVGADRLAELIEPVTPVSTELPFVPTRPPPDAPAEDDDQPDDPESGDANSNDPDIDEADSVDPGSTVAATTTTSTTTSTLPGLDDELSELLTSSEFDTEGVVSVLRSTPEPGTNTDRQLNDVAVWSALAGAAPTTGGSATPVDDFGTAVTAASIDEVFERLWRGPVQVRDLAVDSAESSADDSTGGVSILNRFDALLVFAQISPARVSTPNEGLVFRLAAPMSDSQLAADDSPFESRSAVARLAVGQLLFLQANVASVDATANPDGAPQISRLEVADEQFVAGLEADIVEIFGETEFVVSDQLIDGVDAVLTLGTGYFDVIVSDAAESSDADADTVEDDG